MKRLVILSCSLLLVACATEEEDLRAWMASQERGMVGRVDPLPEIQPFPVVAYDAAGDIDPFAVVRVEPAMQETAVTGGPDMDRRREPLETYPLESLNMVGVLSRDDLTQALINVGGVLHQVRAGNYMGQDHGIVTSITEGEVTLVELVQDIEGNWVERTSQLRLQER